MPADHENAYIPDISITLDVDTPVVTRGAVPHMPDIAIEIKSRDDHYTDLRAKAAYYLANGTKIVWLVYPEKKLVEVYAVGQDSQLYDVTDTLDCGDLLPDFSLPVKTIFGLQ
jgi:Uma2 family endonuclease